MINLTIPNNIKRIGAQAFRDNHDLTSVILPNDVDCVEWVFENCINLNNINIPINGAFTADCLENTAIWNNEENWYDNGLYWDNSFICIRGGNTYDIYNIKNGTKTIATCCIPWDASYDIKLPNSVENILKDAFFSVNKIDLYYEGTINEWNNINKSDDWNGNKNIKMIHCTDGDITL